MTNGIKAIIFDLGNVLIGWDARLLYNRLLPDPETVDRFLNEIHFLEWNAHQDAGRSFREGVAELSAHFPHYADLIQAYDTYWEESLTEPYAEVIDLVRELKESGWRLYLLSNFSLEKFELVTNRYDFLKYFDDMIISGEHRVVKPQPQIFEITLQRIGLPASKCIFIDDSLPNIETAQRLGFQTIHFHSPIQLRNDLNRIIKGIVQ